jgi:hypothetical protein
MLKPISLSDGNVEFLNENKILCATLSWVEDCGLGVSNYSLDEEFAKEWMEILEGTSQISKSTIFVGLGV